MTPEAQRIKALSLAQIPTNRKALAAVAPELVNLYGAPARTFLAVTEFTRARPVLPITNEYWNAIAQARAAAYKMQMTPQAALDDVRKQMQALLDSALQGK